MNRWLYRAAGTVGIAGGALLLGAGSAQADETGSMDSERMDSLLGEVRSPTSGLPPLDLAAADRAPAAGAAETGGLTLDPQDGRPGTRPELLPGLPVLPEQPVGGLDSVLGGLQLGNVPVDGVTVPLSPDGQTSASLGVLPPIDRLVQLDGQLLSLPTDAPLPALPGGPAGTLPAPADRTLPAPADRTLPAPAGAVEQVGVTGGDQEIVGPMTSLTRPLTGALLGGGSLGNVAMVGDLARQVPVAGPVVTQTAGNLPLVSDLVTRPQGPAAPTHRLPVDPVTGTSPTADPLGTPQPASGEQLPALIGQELAAERGLAAETAGGSAELTGGLPLIGPALEPLGKLVGVGNLAGQLPLVGPLAGSTLGTLPVFSGQDPAAPSPGTPDPAAVPDDRPVAGDDPEFTESAELAPAGRAAAELLPVSGLADQLPTGSPLSVLRSLPLVGQVSSVLPL